MIGTSFLHIKGVPLVSIQLLLKLKICVTRGHCIAIKKKKKKDTKRSQKGKKVSMADIGIAVSQQCTPNHVTIFGIAFIHYMSSYIGNCHHDRNSRDKSLRQFI